MAGTRSVPAGIYGRQALSRLGVWRAVEDRIAETSNARTALLLVERGEAPLGIVYASDARAAAVTVVWHIPASTHDPIIYPLARIRSDNAASDAEAFLAFLLSPVGRAIFRRHGFETD